MARHRGGFHWPFDEAMPMTDHRALQLHSPRLRLRALRADDAAALFEIHADPRFTRFWSAPPWTERAQAEALIAQDQLGLAEGAHVRLGVERLADAALLGTCTLYNIHPANRRAELGYGLGPAHWGQGYAGEAVRALLDWGFGPLDLHRVEADIDPANTASAALLARLGFQLEGRLRERWIVGGVVSDSAIYGLLARDWPAARPPG
jgi:ribosomal-protein-alanine N-acetyltransferase